MADPHSEIDDHVRFLRLFVKSEGALRAFLRALLPSREESAEAFQGTSIVLWNKFSEFGPSRDFKAWAFGIARDKALAVICDRQRQRLVSNDDLIAQLPDEAVDMVSMGQDEALDDCLRKLHEYVPPLHRRGPLVSWSLIRCSTSNSSASSARQNHAAGDVVFVSLPLVKSPFAVGGPSCRWELIF